MGTLCDATLGQIFFLLKQFQTMFLFLSHDAFRNDINLKIYS